MSVIRVLVAENHAFLRETIVRDLEQHHDIEVVGLASDGAEAVSAASTLEPDVVVLEGHAPGLRAMEATRQIRALKPSTAVLILGIEIDEMYVTCALEAGASGYLPMTTQSRELADAVRRADRGEIVRPPASAREGAAVPRDESGGGQR